MRHRNADRQCRLGHADGHVQEVAASASGGYVLPWPPFFARRYLLWYLSQFAIKLVLTYVQEFAVMLQPTGGHLGPLCDVCKSLVNSDIGRCGEGED